VQLYFRLLAYISESVLDTTAADVYMLCVCLSIVTSFTAAVVTLIVAVAVAVAVQCKLDIMVAVMAVHQFHYLQQR
jgi:di/tricarboxylate transporter